MTVIRSHYGNEINVVMVVGAGLMGEGIALNLAQSGLCVKLVDESKNILDRCLTSIAVSLGQFSANSLLTEEIPLIISRIQPFLLKNILDVVQESDFVIEAIPEILELKKKLFGSLQSYNPDIVMGSNTSSLTITSIAEGLERPEKIVGMHYFYPAHIIPLVEIHGGKQTTEETIQITQKLIKRAGKTSILVKKELPGFIVNRLQGALTREIDFLIDNGAVSAEDLDIAVRSSIGLRYALFGPMAVYDLNGLDTVLRISQSVFKTLSNSSVPSATLRNKVEKGELGIKSGKGWYDYRDRKKDHIISENNEKILQLMKFLQSYND